MNDNLVPLRVLHVFASLDRGGAEAMLMTLYRKLDRTKIQFDFVVNDQPALYAHEEEIQRLGGRVYRMPALTAINLFKYYRGWVDLFKRHPEWNAVHAHHTSSAFLYLQAAKKNGLVTIAHSHTAGYEKNIKSISKIVTRYPLRFIADHLFACTPAAASWMFGSKSAKVVLLNNSVDSERLIFSESTRAYKRRELGLSDEFVVGHIGRFEAPKNHDFLIDVFFNIKQKRSSAILLLVGDGALKYDIEKKVGALGLEDSVVFLGSRPDVDALLSAMDTFLFPSLYEGLGLVLIEAQASGLRCIASDSIPSEVKITNELEFMSLGLSAGDWADSVLDDGGYERKNTYEQIVGAGYDVEKNVRWLERFYLQIASKARR